MFTLKDQKKFAGVIALFAVCGLTAGCDDYYDDHHHHPHPRPPHEGRRDDHRRDDHHRDDHHHRGDHHRDDHHGHRPPPRNENHRKPNDGSQRHERRRHASLVGAYSARALNDAVMPKGTTISLNVIEGENASLRLVDPTGKQYPIRFDAETGTGYIAGGSLSLREDGLFVYKDARGGIWLVERQ